MFFDKIVNCCVPGCTNYSAKSTNISDHKIPKDPQLRKAWSDNEEGKLLSNDEDDDDCIISSQERHSTTDTEPESECYLESCISEAKYLVFWSSLKELFRFCMKCRSTITEISFACTGSMLTVRTSCMNEHDSSWNSQPLLSSTPLGDLLCSSILFTGNTFKRIQNFAACLGLKFLSERVFINIKIDICSLLSMMLGKRRDKLWWRNL